MLTFFWGCSRLFLGVRSSDIETIRQPDWKPTGLNAQTIEQLQVRSNELRQLADLDRQIKRQEAEQRVFQDGSRNLETMRQLVESPFHPEEWPCQR